MRSRLVANLASALLATNAALTREELVSIAPEVVAEYSPLATSEELEAAIDLLVGLGPIEPLLHDPAISDVLVNGPDQVYVDRHGRLEQVDVQFTDDDGIVAAVERVIAPLGLRLDRASPAVDARLPDGSRLHALIPPASVDGPVLAVRRFTSAVETLEEMHANGSLTAVGAEYLRAAVRERRNLLVGGATGSGKTTLLNVLSGEIPMTERVVTIEDSAELQLRGHVLRLEARPPNVDGAGEIRMSELVRHGLRLRPDRIVVGEVRGPEALDMIAAMSTGHRGSMSTIHSNSHDETLTRLEMLALSAPTPMTPETVRRQIAACVDVVVQMERSDRGRRVTAIAELADGSVVDLVPC